MIYSTKTVYAILSAFLLLTGGLQAQAPDSDAPPLTRVYALNGGTLTVPDANLLSDTDGLPDNLYTDLPVPAFLIVHGDSLLLFDAGLPIGHAALPSSKAPSLREQIRSLGFDPDAISALALSHLHFDHAGQAADFPRARLLVGGADYTAVLNDEADDFDRPMIAPWDRGGPAEKRVRQLHGDMDLYGDGAVRFVSTPGHTPGHYALRIELAEAGPILLSGDLYHTRFSRAHGLISDFDHNRAASLASQARTERLLALDGARLIIMHDPADYARLPALPGYLH